MGLYNDNKCNKVYSDEVNDAPAPNYFIKGTTGSPDTVEYFLERIRTELDSIRPYLDELDNKLLPILCAHAVEPPLETVKVSEPKCRLNEILASFLNDLYIIKNVINSISSRVQL